MKNIAAKREPKPKKGKDVVLPHVIRDLKDRAVAGMCKYGTPLETKNGRDALMDAYQEALDMVMYLRQALLERGYDDIRPPSYTVKVVCSECGRSGEMDVRHE